MTEFFEAFNPAARHLREQKDLEKVLVARHDQGDRGPRPLDLDSGRVRLVMPGTRAAAQPVTVQVAGPEHLAAAGRVCVRAWLDGGEVRHDDPYLDVLRDVATRAREAEVWVALDGDEVIGCVTWCGIGSGWRDVAGDGEGEFRMLAVDPAAHGRGIGRLLATAMVDRARDEGLGAVVISSANWMTSAHRLYRSLGFVRVPERDWSPRPGKHLQVFRLKA